MPLQGQLGDSIPSLDDFEQKLAAISATSLAADSGLGELDLAGLENSLDSLDGLTLDEADGGPSLCDLIRLAERYPGLKISLSF
jgi:hypothetical protein